MTFITDGAVFEISRTSLSKVALETFPMDARGSYVLEGDADCVSAILNYYRTGQLHIPQVCMFVLLPCFIAVMTRPYKTAFLLSNAVR